MVNAQKAPTPTLNSKNQKSKALSLLQLLDPNLTEIASLSYRFRVAHKIAQAVISMHACGLMHKGIKSQNILFFGTEDSINNTLEGKTAPKYPHIMESPYISGFSYSRPDESRAFSDTKNTENIYLHPAYLQNKLERYKTSYDLYSLGFVLIEIARWVPIEEFYKQDRKQNRCSDLGQFKTLMLARAEKLGFIMGDIYRDVVLYCLTCDFEDEDSTKGRVKYIEEINERVVLRLQKCVA
jgi:serine/threonine protein kinase